jgi:hypothetical protein
MGVGKLGNYSVIARFNPENNPEVVKDYEPRYFETNTQCMEVSHYGNLITRSCDSSPEHSVVYVNEVRQNLAPPRKGMTLAGLSIKSARNYTSADQLNVWVGSGTQNSNSFPALVSYLLDKAAHTANLSSAMVDQGSFTSAAAFCEQNKLFFDGVIAERQNLRSFIASTAPFFLLTLTVRNGKLGLYPGIPTGSPTALFTAGNILEGSLKVNYIPESDRRPFQAVASYRTNPRNQLPRVQTIRATWSDGASHPMEQLDMTQFCTSHQHAVLAARYLMAIRRYVTKTVNFQTTPDQATLAPGDFINLAVEQLSVSTGNTGAITRSGEVVTPVHLPDGTYDVYFYKEGMEAITESMVEIKNGEVHSPEHWGSLFAVRERAVTTQRYIVDQVQLTEEGLVDVQASEFPDAIADATFNGSGITITPSTPSTC